MPTLLPFINSLTNNRFSAWDILRLGGDTVPGVWQLRANKKRDLIIVKLRLRDGVGILDNGYFGVGLSATGRFWLPQQWATFQEQFPKFDPPQPGGTRSPLAIFHPAAAFLGVSTVYISEFDLPPPSGGYINISIEMVQWFPRPKPFIQGFAGTRKAGAPLASDEFNVPVPPSANTGDKL